MRGEGSFSSAAPGFVPLVGREGGEGLLEPRRSMG